MIMFDGTKSQCIMNCKNNISTRDIEHYGESILIVVASVLLVLQHFTSFIHNIFITSLR